MAEEETRQGMKAFGDTSLSEKFWSKVEPEPNSGCWLWSGWAQTRYGGFGRHGLAHRVAYETLTGKVPVGLELDHLCRVTMCVNPYHLEPVTHKENLLRGKTVAAKHAQQTHCHNGHALTGLNLYIRPGGQRSCMMCRRHNVRVWRAKQCVR